MTIATDAGLRRVELEATDDPTTMFVTATMGDVTEIAAPNGWSALGVDPAGRSPTSASATRTPSSPSTISTPSTSQPSAVRCPTSTWRSSRQGRTPTRSRCVSTNVVSGSPRRAELGPAPRPWLRRGGVWPRRATGNSSSTWTADVQALDSDARRRRDVRVAQRSNHLRRHDRAPMTNTPYSEALGATLIERTLRERIVLVGVAFPE